MMAHPWPYRHQSPRAIEPIGAAEEAAQLPQLVAPEAAGRNGDDRECHVNEEHEPQALQDPVLQQHLIDEFGEEHLKKA